MTPAVIPVHLWRETEDHQIVIVEAKVTEVGLELLRSSGLVVTEDLAPHMSGADAELAMHCQLLELVAREGAGEFPFSAEGTTNFIKSLDRVALHATSTAYKRGRALAAGEAVGVLSKLKTFLDDNAPFLRPLGPDDYIRNEGIRIAVDRVKREIQRLEREEESS